MNKKQLNEVIEDYSGYFSRDTLRDLNDWMGEDSDLAARDGIESTLFDIASALVRIQIAARDEAEDGEDGVAEDAPTILLVGSWKWGKGRTFARALRNLGCVPVAIVISDDPYIRMDVGGGIVYDGAKGYTMIPLSTDAPEFIRPRND